ncbi:Cytochrome P450 6a20 [Carabus blaptoides fortunei]
MICQFIIIFLYITTLINRIKQSSKMALIFYSFGADLIALIIVLITSAYFYLKYKFTYWSKRGVVCVPPSLPFGNVNDQLLMNKSLGEIVEDVYVKLKKDGHKYGGMYMLAIPNFVPVDPDLVKTIMTGEFKSFHDRDTFVNEEMDPLSGNLFALKGYKWRNLRVKLTPTFTSGKMKLMFQMLRVCGDQLDEAMGNCVTQKGPIDIKDILGMRFGLMQTKVGLGVLLNNYNFTLNEKTVSPLVMDPVGLVLASKTGVWLNVEKAKKMFYFSSLGADLIAILVVLITTVYLYFKYTYTYWSKRGVPTIKPIVPFGNIKDNTLLKTSFGESIRDIYVQLKKTGAKYGGIYILGRPGFLVIDPDLIKTIMTSEFHSFHDRAIFTNEKEEPLTGHLFAIKGSKWRSLRTKLTPTFTSGKMKMMFQTLLVCGEQLDETIGLQSKQSGPLDIKDFLARFTTDVIGSVAFGLDCNSLKDPDAEFRRYGKMLFTTSIFKTLLRNTSLAFPGLLKLLKMKFIKPEITNFFMNAVRQTIDYREHNKVIRNDFMDLLIKLKNNESVDDEKQGTNSEPGLTFNEIAAQAFVFFVAGFETSSSTMAFCLYELCSNIGIQEKLREEILKTFNENDEKFTYDSIMEMRYMDKVLKVSVFLGLSILYLTCHQDNDGIVVWLHFNGFHRSGDIYATPLPTFSSKRVEIFADIFPILSFQLRLQKKNKEQQIKIVILNLWFKCVPSR